MNIADVDKINKHIKINKRLIQDFNYLREDLGYNVVGVFLQGSQNYGLDYEGSDIDTKAIILPSFRDIILNKKPKSTTIIKEDNSHLDVKDIRLMFNCFKKQNINFLEILFTEYKFLNVEYAKLLKPLFDNAEMIANYNNIAGIHCIAGMIYEKHKAMEHPYEGIKDKIIKYGYDCKQLHHILRCYEFLVRRFCGEAFGDCLKSQQRDFLIDVKRNCFNLEEARDIADLVLIAARDIKQEFLNENEITINTEVDSLLEEVLISCFQYSLKGEI